MRVFQLRDLHNNEEIGMDRYCKNKVRYATNIHVRRDDRRFILRSYMTDVCAFDVSTGVLMFNGAYSRSTTAHIGAFFNLIVWNYDNRLTPILDAFTAVYLNEKIKSNREFFDRIEWINCKNGNYCIKEKRGTDDKEMKRVYRYR